MAIYVSRSDEVIYLQDGRTVEPGYTFTAGEGEYAALSGSDDIELDEGRIEFVSGDAGTPPRRLVRVNVDVGDGVLYASGDDDTPIPISGTETTSASALTTGTLAPDRLADASVPLAKLDANPLARANHTGTQSVSTITGTVPIAQVPTGTSGSTVALGNAPAGAQAAAIASAATDATTKADAAQAAAIQRANHTGSQSITTVTGTVPIAQVPTGTTGATVALGNAPAAAQAAAIATAATDATTKADAAQAAAIQRANHTGQQPASTISDFTEAVQDAVAATLAEGSGATITYNDAAGTITIATAGGVADTEAVRDAIGVALVGVGNITVTVNDGADTITVSTTATVNATDAQLRDRSLHTGSQTASTISDFTAAAKTAAGLYVMPFGRAGTLTATAGHGVGVVPVASTFVGVWAGLGTAANQDVIADIHANGTTVYTTQGNRPTVPAGQLIQVAIATPDVTAIAAGTRLTCDLDQIGGPTQIAWVASTAQAPTSTFNPSVPRPATTAVGDILIAAVRVSRTAGNATATTVNTPPSGWTLIASAFLQAADQDVHYFWRRDDGAAGPWVFPVQNGSGFTGSWIGSFRNCLPSGSPVDVASAAALGFTSSHVGPSVTTTTTGGLLLHLSHNAAAVTWTTESGMTRIDPTGSQNWHASTLQLTATGATGTKTATSSASGYSNDLMLALKADPSSSLPGEDFGLSALLRVA